MKKILIYSIIVILLLVINLIVLKNVYSASLTSRAHKIIVYINKVEFVDVPVKQNSYSIKYRQDVKITFSDGVLQVPRDRILNTIIPLGEVEIITYDKFRNDFEMQYKFKKVN